MRIHSSCLYKASSREQSRLLFIFITLSCSEKQHCFWESIYFASRVNISHALHSPDKMLPNQPSILALFINSTQSTISVFLSLLLLAWAKWLLLSICTENPFQFHLPEPGPVQVIALFYHRYCFEIQAPFAVIWMGSSVSSITAKVVPPTRSRKPLLKSVRVQQPQ